MELQGSGLRDVGSVVDDSKLNLEVARPQIMMNLQECLSADRAYLWWIAVSENRDMLHEHLA